MEELFGIKLKLFFREFPAVFFTLFFSPMILVIFGVAYGNEPSAIFNNLGSMDVSVPAYIGLIIAGVGLISLPVAIAASKERGELRRLKMTPISPMVYMLSDLIVYYLLTIVGVVILAAVGKIFYNTKYTGNIFYTFIALSVSIFAIFAMGFLLVSISKTARIAQALGMFLTFPMMFMSGAGLPLELMPPELLKVANFIPLKHVVTLMRGMWIGNSLLDHTKELMVLLGIFVVCSALAIKTFKWE